MKKLHIAFISYPFPAYVNPTIPLVSSLVRRGHRVSYATSEGFVNRMAALGAEVITCPPIRLDELFAEGKVKNSSGLQSFCAPMVDSVPKLVEFYEQHRPDVVLHSNLAIGGHIVTAKLCIPRIQFYSTFALDKSNLFRQMRDAKYRQEITEASTQFDALLQQHGVPSEEFFFRRGDLSIYFVPKTLQPLGELFGPDCIFAGRCAVEQSHHAKWQRQDTGGRPVVLVATSSMFVKGQEYFRMCIDALKDLPVHIILSIGDRGRPEWYDPLPSHFEVVQGIPHAQIMPHVDLLVFPSGTISTTEAMYHGVPMIVISHGFKQLEWQGENIDSLGIGIHLRNADTTAESVAHFVNQILTDSNLQKRVQDFKHLVRRDIGAEELANLVEEYIAGIRFA